MTRAHGLPTSAGQTILGGVNGFARALALVITDVQTDWLSPKVHIGAVHVIANA
jgi:phosphate/sulfate permease